MENTVTSFELALVGEFEMFVELLLLLPLQPDAITALIAITKRNPDTRFINPPALHDYLRTLAHKKISVVQVYKNERFYFSFSDFFRALTEMFDNPCKQQK